MDRIVGAIGRHAMETYCARLVSCAAVLLGALWSFAAAGQDNSVLRVLSYNIHHAEGTDGKTDYKRLAKVISELNPDVVALQEVDQSTSRSKGVDQAKRLSELTGMQSVFGAAMPFAGGHYGLAVLSRYPITDSSTFPLPYQFGEEPRAVMTTEIQPDDGLPAFVLMNTHLSHQNEATRAQQVQGVMGRVPSNNGQPVLLAGDFNARPDSPPMKLLWEKQWIDAVAPQSVIDYVLIRKEDRWKVRDVTIPDNRVVSDHRPVLVELEWERRRVGKVTPSGLTELVELEAKLQDAIASVEDAIVAIDGGTGGGVLVSADGYVLTAAHVSGFGRDVRVRLADGSNYDAKSLGAYRFADAAMVKIEGDGPFPYVPLASLGETEVGDWCFALGNPGGLDKERGVVSRIGRVISKTENLLRSDCRIIGGDSGCALFSAEGELIGIHSRIGMPLDQNYHAPIDAILTHWDAMKAGDVLPPQTMRGRGGFGVRTRDAFPGVKIVDVRRDNSPLREGDVIRQFDDYLIEDDWEYLVAMSSKRIGDRVQLRVIRDGAWMDLEVEVKRSGSNGRRRRN